jgi:Cdc6-like AAA superfamily ATPase
MSTKVQSLRMVVQEGIRVQKGGAETIEYVDVTRALSDVIARQNHVIFGRRGCGKTLLLHAADRRLPEHIRVVYINCEDYKQHSFPNILIEILDRIFAEMERRESADEQQTKVKETSSVENTANANAKLEMKGLGGIGAGATAAQKAAIEEEYSRYDSKIQKLNLLLPRFKESMGEFFDLSAHVKSVFIELDDFYHLPRTMHHTSPIMCIVSARIFRYFLSLQHCATQQRCTLIGTNNQRELRKGTIICRSMSTSRWQISRKLLSSFQEFC